MPPQNRAKGSNQKTSSHQPFSVAVVQSLGSQGQYRPQAQEPYELRGQGEHQDGCLFAVEEKGREGQDQHRDEQGEGRQPIDAAADPALEAEKDLLQFHRILGGGVLSGDLIGLYGGRSGLIYGGSGNGLIPGLAA